MCESSSSGAASGIASSARSGGEGALPVSIERRPDQLAREAGMAFGIVRKAEIGAPGVFRSIVHAAIGIDFQHERRAAAVDTQIAAPKARTLERDEEAGGSIAQGVGTPVRGGPTYRESQLCMEMVADTGRLSSLDITELNPAFDHRNATAELAVDLVESLFGKSTLIREHHAPSGDAKSGRG